MVEKMQMRLMWTVVDHVCCSKNAERCRDVWTHPTVLAVFVDPIFVKVSIVNKDRTSTSTETIIVFTLKNIFIVILKYEKMCSVVFTQNKKRYDFV